jgi:hypothetical protein
MRSLVPLKGLEFSVVKHKHKMELLVIGDTLESSFIATHCKMCHKRYYLFVFSANLTLSFKGYSRMHISENEILLEILNRDKGINDLRIILEV